MHRVPRGKVMSFKTWRLFTIFFFKAFEISNFQKKSLQQTLDSVFLACK